jgi:hypothetical protein
MRFIPIIVACSLLASCEKVLNVELESSEAKVVIEGILTDKAGTCMVIVSQTRSFSESNDFEGVANASVSITDDLGNIYQLSEVNTGVFIDSSLTAISGHSYLLSVNVDGNTYSSRSDMPNKIKLDSLFMSVEDTHEGKRNMANVVFTDPKDAQNYYRFVQYKNGLRDGNIFIRSDERTNGNVVILPIRYPAAAGNEIKSGDTVMIDILSINSDIYTYWKGINSNTHGVVQSSIPSNPITNIQGGALGYFSTHAIDTKWLVVK